VRRKIGHVIGDPLVECALHVARVELGPDGDRLEVNRTNQKSKQTTLE